MYNLQSLIRLRLKANKFYFIFIQIKKSNFISNKYKRLVYVDLHLPHTQNIYAAKALLEILPENTKEK